MIQPPDKPTISIIIPVYNGGEKFQKCLMSIAENTVLPKETIVVADGESDGSWRIAEEFDTHILKISTPGGPARARNLGAQRATGDILFFVDADVTIAKNSVAMVIDAFQKDPEITALIGSYDDEPFETNFLSQYKNLFHHYVHQTSNEEASTFWGACGAVRRETFLETGGFDEKYRHPSIEDIELGCRLKKAGRRIRLIKNLQVKHLKRWEILSLLRADIFYRAIPWTGLIMREGRFTDDLNISISSRICVALIYLLIISLAGMLLFPWIFILAAILMTMLLAINRGLYCFFKRKRGICFALKTVPWHWLYFFYSGLAFLIGVTDHQIKKTREKGL